MAELTKKQYLDQAGVEELVKNVKTIVTSGDASVENKVTALENGTVKDNTDAITKLNGGEEVEGSVKAQIKSAVDSINGAASTLGDKVKKNEDAIAAINNAETGIAKVAADNLAAAKSELEGKITEEATTARVAERQNASDITTLKGDENTEGSVAKSVKDAINDFATKISDDGVVNTFKELVDYAAKSGSDIADLVARVGVNESAISALKTLVGALPEDVTATTVVGYIAEAVKAEETRAKGIEGGLDTRVAAIEAKFSGEDSVAKQIEDAVAAEATIARKAEKANANAIAKETTDRATAITSAIGALDAEVTHEAGTDGLALEVVEVDGKINSITGSIAANTYAPHSLVATVDANKTAADTKAENEAKAAYDAVTSIPVASITALFTASTTEN